MTVPSLSTRVRRALDEAHVAKGARVLAACSGGLDSQVLLDALAHVSRSGRIELVAHGVDHGLRAEAKDELALAARLAESRSIPFSTTLVSVASGANLQARAREQRWSALFHAAKRVGAAFVATGHHADDRAETVLIRILRGAPLAALAVLAARSQVKLVQEFELESGCDSERTRDRELVANPSSLVRIRPLIHARRTELETHAISRGIFFAEDPSNLDRRHLRVRVRHEVLPVLRALDPRIVEHLCALAEQAAALANEPLRDSAELSRDPLRASSRALAALRDAARRKNVRARIPLGQGRIARWDASLGIVISSTNAFEIASTRSSSENSLGSMRQSRARRGTEPRTRRA